MAFRAIRSFAGRLRPAAATGGGCGAAAATGGVCCARTRTGPSALVEAAAAVRGNRFYRGAGRNDDGATTPPFPRIIYPQGLREQREDALLEKLERILDDKDASKETKELCLKLAADVKNLDFKVEMINGRLQEFEGTLEANEKIFNEATKEVNEKVHEVDKRSKVTDKDLENFKGTSELRAKKVQYDVYKSLGWVGGVVATYTRFKNQIDPFIDKVLK